MKRKGLQGKYISSWGKSLHDRQSFAYKVKQINKSENDTAHGEVIN